MVFTGVSASIISSAFRAIGTCDAYNYNIAWYVIQGIIVCNPCHIS